MSSTRLHSVASLWAGLAVACLAGTVTAQESQPSSASKWPPKTSRSLLTDEQIERARVLCRTNKQAERVYRGIIDSAQPWLAFSDEQLRAMLPDSRVPRAFDLSVHGCPVHGEAIFRYGTYPWKLDPKHPFSVVCPVGHERYPSNDFQAYYLGGMKDRSLLTGPYADDGWGWTSPTGEKYWFVAYACHHAWMSSWRPAVTALSQAYVLTGQRVYAQKAAAMLDRIAEVYPGMDYNSQSRLGQIRAERKSGPYEGKILNSIWETGVFKGLAVAYDQIFDTLVGPEPIRLSWRSADRIRNNIEQNLLEDGIAAIFRNQICGNFGMHQDALVHAALVRQTGPTREWLSRIMSGTHGGAVHQGLDYAFYNLVFKDGMPNEVSPGYASHWINNMASLAGPLARAGIDLFRRPRFQLMLDAPLQILCIGRFTPNIGDSGSLNEGWVTPLASSYTLAYGNLKYPRYAWAAEHLGGFRQVYASFDDLFRPVWDPGHVRQDIGEYQHQPSSRFLDGFGVTVLNNRSDSLAASVWYGMSSWHAHRDRLNLELFGRGRRLSPDLGYPDTMNDSVSGIYSWTQNTVSHNCMIVDDQMQLGKQPGRVLRFHDSPTVDVVDLDAPGTYPQASVYRRTLVFIEADHENAYLVDVFRVKGGQTHTLSIHGNEADFRFAGPNPSAPVTEGTFAGRDVPYGAMYDDARLNATGYQGGFSTYQGSGYSHLFNYQRVATPDRVVSGNWTYQNRPAANLNVHVLPDPLQEVILADAFVSPRKKAPMLKYMLIRRPAGQDGNTFVAVWEMAGEKPFIDEVNLQEDPSLGIGANRVAALSVHRGKAIDVILVAPESGVPICLGSMINTDAAVTVLTVEDGRAGRLFAAGGSAISGGEPARTVEVFPSLRGRVADVDYQARRIAVETEQLADPARLVTRTVRMSNPQHSCVYRIGAASIQHGQLWLDLAGSDVLVGRVRVNDFDPVGSRIITATELQFGWALAGTHLLTNRFAGSWTVVSAGKGMIQLNDERHTMADLLVKGEDAWIADFGLGDLVEIEGGLYR